MYSIISTEQYSEQIKEAVSSVSGDIIFSRTGLFDFESLVGAFEAAARVTCAVLIVDIGIGPEKCLLQGIKIYRQARPTVRIILLAPGRQPGDSTVSKLFDKGVYDIIAPELPDMKGGDEEQAEEVNLRPLIKKALESKAANYADAIRWDVDTGTDGNIKDKPKIIKVIGEKGWEQRTIIRDNIVGNVVIAVASASRGIGCTHVVFSIAYFIYHKDRKLKIAVLESNNKGDFLEANNGCEPALLEDSFTYENIDFYTKKTDLLQLLSLKKYDYIILDFGLIKSVYNSKVTLHEHYNEFLRSHVPILVCGTKLWQLRDIKNALYKDAEDTDTSDTDNWKILFNFIDDKMYNEIEKDFDWDTYRMPFSPRLFSYYKEVDDLFNNLLSEVLPKSEVIAGKRSKWPFIR